MTLDDPEGARIRRTLAVVLPSYRRLERIPPLVREYLAQDADQVVMVLDGPHEGWQEILAAESADPRVIVAELPENRGLALARIAGLDLVTCDIVLAVDDDVEPKSDLVARHRAFHAALADRVLQGYMPVSLPTRRGRDHAPTFLYARDYEAQVRGWVTSGSSDILGSLWGGNVSLPTDLYRRGEAVKPSVRLEYNEDLDLGRRLGMLGAEATFDPAARALHHHRRGLDGFRRECLARGGAVRMLEARWGERPAQLTPMVEIPASYNRVLAELQRRISRRDRSVAERLVVGLYRFAGGARLWALQDGIARMLRRAYIMRGYRDSAPATARVTAGKTDGSGVGEDLAAPIR
ncbi:glycosyltransferase [Microbacterium sp. ET2]|uniref:glycosyltransferase family 2 protein n=1 Tax=Microbacterium albipurpureum TaxID=3050384 RepID=UPI00259CEFA6|nr:glycosyltransferase [Microbacterium sp. ET2 (Ac-2212)]WJL94724.1 glycosyltransferase [Microbacterium sp. ET2 (Ac-2212)]